MFVDRFFVEGLAHASYLFGEGNEAAVVDPKRDVADYLEAAARRGVKIVAIFETHPHADFVSGHLDLQQATGAPIYVSRLYPAKYPHMALKHGDQLMVGGLSVTALETPGHSPDSLSIYAESGESEERIVFSGDVLFVGDVGRPDLRDMHADPGAMASALYDTLHQVFWKLPEETVVYPAHGAGSLCGRRLGSAPSTTIGAEKRDNWVNQFRDREEFIQAMISNLPTRPLFFYHCPFANLQGPELLENLKRPRLVPAEELAALLPTVLPIDLRQPEAFGEVHLRGVVGIGSHLPLFSTWVGTLAEPHQRLLLIAESQEQADQAWLDLARIGYENVVGYTLTQPDEWKVQGLPLMDLPQLEVSCIDAWVQQDRTLLDVRTTGEWERGAVQGALHIPLSELSRRMNEVPPGPIAVMCGSGYRSTIAASLLQRDGREEVVNLRGGWGAYASRSEREPDTQEIFCQALFNRFPAYANR